jgi:hypothetical protein
MQPDREQIDAAIADEADDCIDRVSIHQVSDDVHATTQCRRASRL